MARNYFLFVIALFLCQVASAREAIAGEHVYDKSIKDGDILFKKSRSRQSDAITIATHSPYSHCGIAMKENGKWIVYEAVQPVRKASLNSWVNSNILGNLSIRRLKNADKVLDRASLSKMRAYLETQLGKPYDLKFKWTDEKMYCSELIWKAYNHATGLRIGEPKKFREFDLTSSYVKAKLKSRFAERVPLDEIVIPPNVLYESELLISPVPRWRG